MSDVAGGSSGSVGRRETRRRDREGAYLQAAMGIVAGEGLHALTMNRLAAEVGAAVGTVYTYFPSKGALVAELQRDAVERITDAYRDLQARSDELMASWDDPGAEAVTRLALFGRFWISLTESLPREAGLLHDLIGDAEHYIPDTERHRNLPSVYILLAEAYTAVETAIDVGAIRDGAAFDMVVRWAAALTGVLRASKFAHVDPVAFDGQRLAVQLQRDLLLGWGAGPDQVARAEAHIDSLGALSQLHPGDVQPSPA